jgi:hypothetical protein
VRGMRRDKRFCSDRCRYRHWDRLNPRSRIGGVMA